MRLRFGRPRNEPRHELAAERSERETELLAQLSAAKGKAIELKLELTIRTGERDELRKQVALKQHLIGQLEASLRQFNNAVQDYQDQLAKAEETIARLEREAAQMPVTAEGLGSAMSRLEIPGQRDGEVER